MRVHLLCIGLILFFVTISRATWAITSTNILTLGQSGFIGPGSSDFDAHFMDQLPIFKTFDYKPMHLFINTQLKE